MSFFKIFRVSVALKILGRRLKDKKNISFF